MKRVKTTPYLIDENVRKELLDWFKDRRDDAIIPKELFRYRGTTTWIHVWKEVSKKVEETLKNNPDYFFAGQKGSWWFTKHESTIWRTTIQVDKNLPAFYLISKTKNNITPFSFIQEHMTRYMLDSGITTGYTIQSMTGILEKQGIHFLNQFFSERFFNKVEILEENVSKSRLLEREKHWIEKEVNKDRREDFTTQFQDSPEELKKYSSFLDLFDYVLNTDKVLGRKPKFLEKLNLYGYSCYEMVSYDGY